MRKSVIKGVVLGLVTVLGTVAQAQSLVVISDINGRYGSEEYHRRVPSAVQKIIELAPDAVIITGDMIAAQASPPLEAVKLDRMWAAFDKTVAAPLTRAGIPLIPVAGNHDASSYSRFAGDRKAYARYWNNRRPALPLFRGSRFPWHYAVLFEDTLLVSLYGTAPGTLPAEQQNFLAEMLKGPAEKVQSVLVATHLPLFPVAQGREKETLALGQDRDFSTVDAWLAGHHHAYYPGRSESGVVQLSVPPLGGHRRQWMGSEHMSPFGFLRIEGSGAVTVYAAPDYLPADITTAPEQIGALTYMPHLSLPLAGKLLKPQDPL